jgi:hypothetical protein
VLVYFAAAWLVDADPSLIQECGKWDFSGESAGLCRGREKALLGSI